jgi:hypothetical protein
MIDLAFGTLPYADGKTMYCSRAKAVVKYHIRIRLGPFESETIVGLRGFLVGFPNSNQ